jgi:hypothetical protein
MVRYKLDTKSRHTLFSRACRIVRDDALRVSIPLLREPGSTHPTLAKLEFVASAPSQNRRLTTSASYFDADIAQSGLQVVDS